jgi:hypothetical protein
MRKIPDPQLARVAAYHLVLLLNRQGDFARAGEILSRYFSHGTASDQIIFAFGLTSLHVPLLPTEVDPSKDALLQSAGHLAILLAQGQPSQTADGYPALLDQYPNAPSFIPLTLRRCSRQDAKKKRPRNSNSNPNSIRIRPPPWPSTLIMFREAVSA